MKTVVYIDGLTEPVNPGGAATYGLVIYQDGKKIYEEKKFIGEGEGFSNNVAEYSALIAALRWLMQKGIAEDIEIRSDSRLLVNQMNGLWKGRKGLYYDYYLKAKELRDSFRGIEFKWIPRERNREADRLSRQAYEEYRRYGNSSS